MGGKLFSPEDFDKLHTSKNAHKTRMIVASILTVLLLIAAIIYLNYPKNDNSLNGQENSIIAQSVPDVKKDNEADYLQKDSDINVKNKNEEEPAEQVTLNGDQIEKADRVPNNSIKENVSNNSDYIEGKARQVIRGDYGNGNVRKQKLGEEYLEIQNAVNDMYRRGLVK